MRMISYGMGLEHLTVSVGSSRGFVFVEANLGIHTLYKELTRMESRWIGSWPKTGGAFLYERG